MVNNLLIKNNFLARMIENLQEDGFVVINLSNNAFIAINNGQTYYMQPETFTSSFDLRQSSSDLETGKWLNAAHTEPITLFTLDNQFVVVSSRLLEALKERQTRFTIEDLVDYGKSLKSWIKSRKLKVDYEALEPELEETTNE